MRLDYVLKIIDTIRHSRVDTIGRMYVYVMHQKEWNSSLWPLLRFASQLEYWNVKWQVFWFTIPNRRIQFAIGSTGLNCLWTWKWLQYAFFFSYYLVYRNSLCSLRSQNRHQSKFNSSRFSTFHSKFLCGGILQRHIKSLLAIRKKWDISPDSEMQIERCDADLYIAKVGRHLESADFNGVYVKLGPSFDLRGFAPRECLCNLQHPLIVVTLLNLIF